MNHLFFSQLGFAELFIEHGADVNAKGRFQFSNKTALDLATSEKCKHSTLSLFEIVSIQKYFLYFAVKEYLRSKMA